MGIEFCGFIGRKADLRAWRQELRSAVVCRFGNGELGLVPLTGALSSELRTRMLKEEEVTALDGDANVSPSASMKEGVRRWLERASRGITVGHFDLFEFGDMGHELGAIWVNGSEVIKDQPVSAIVAYFRDRAGTQVGGAELSVERHRGDSAAEKWVQHEIEK
jgi:hypothetical protein